MKNLLIIICMLSSLGLLGQKKIMIDPGHGYTNGDPNQGNPDGRTATEINTNFAVSQKLYDRLRTCPAITGYQTTTNRKFIYLSQRVAISNNYQVDRFLSIHCNASGPVCCGNGTETFYYTNTTSPGRAWAQKVQSKMVYRGSWFDRGTKPGNFYVLRNTNAFACLSEIGFVDNSSNAAKLNDNGWRDKFALAYEEAMAAEYGLTCNRTTAKPGSFSAYASAKCYNGNNYIRLTWTKSSSATSYKIYRNGAYYTTVSGTAFNNWTVGNGGTTYRYRVVAVNSSGSTWNGNGNRYATALSCNSNSVQGTDEISASENTISYSPSDIVLSPNPTSSSLRVSFHNPDVSSIDVAVYDLNGRVVLKGQPVTLDKGSSETSVDVSNLTPGVYILRCTTSEGVYNEKFTKE